MVVASTAASATCHKYVLTPLPRAASWPPRLKPAMLRIPEESGTLPAPSPSPHPPLPFTLPLTCVKSSCVRPTRPISTVSPRSCAGSTASATTFATLLARGHSSPCVLLLVLLALPPVVPSEGARSRYCSPVMCCRLRAPFGKEGAAGMQQQGQPQGEHQATLHFTSHTYGADFRLNTPCREPSRLMGQNKHGNTKQQLCCLN